MVKEHYYSPIFRRPREKARWQLHKNVKSNIKQVPEAARLIAAALRPPTSYYKTIQVRRTKHVGHCWRSKNDLISDILPWTSSHGRAKAGRRGRNYIQQLCAETGYSLKTSWEQCTIETGMQERAREIRAGSVTLGKVKWNANSFVKDFKSGDGIQFQRG